MPALIRPFKIRHSVIIEVGGCPIGLAPSLQYLDASKLEEVERAEIEVGVVEGTCCNRTVRATVEKGWKKFLARPQAIVTTECFCVCIFGTVCWICCVADDGSESGCSPW